MDLSLSDAQMIELYLIPKQWNPAHRSRIPEEDVYSLRKSELEAITDRQNGSFFLTKRTDQRYCVEGCWVRNGDQEGVFRPSDYEFIGTKTKYRYHLRAADTKTEWYITEYCIMLAYRLKMNIPNSPDEYALCRIDRVRN